MATVLDIGIDLGTASVVIYGKGKGVVLNEPAVIAFDRDTRNVLAVGEDARRMIGRTPGNIVAMRPLGDGMIADFELVSAMLRYFVTKVVGKRLLGGPRVLISLPAGSVSARSTDLPRPSSSNSPSRTRTVSASPSTALRRLESTYLPVPSASADTRT